MKKRKLSKALDRVDITRFLKEDPASIDRNFEA